MNAAYAYPQCALPFTVIADGELLHLIAGEDVRYSIRAGSLASSMSSLLRRCDGRTLLSTLLLEVPDADREAARKLMERLYGERILIDGPVEGLLIPNSFRLAVEGRGELADRLKTTARERRFSLEPEPTVTEAAVPNPANQSLWPILPASVTQSASALSVLCQDALDPGAVLQFNTRCQQAAAGPWLWATTGPASRGFVSPVFLPNAGPCLECLMRHFQWLSPAPHLYESLVKHGQNEGHFTAVPFPSEGLTILEQLVFWKLGQLNDSPLSAVFRLHVLELDSMEVSGHRVFKDPACQGCSRARMV